MPSQLDSGRRAARAEATRAGRWRGGAVLTFVLNEYDRSSAFCVLRAPVMLLAVGVSANPYYLPDTEQYMVSMYIVPRL